MGLVRSALTGRRVAGPARTALTIGLLAATTLSSQAWLATRGRHSATAVALSGVTPVLLTFGLVVAGGTALMVLLQPKNTVREALAVVAGANVILALLTARPALAIGCALALGIVLTAKPLWWEISDRRASHTGQVILFMAATALIGMFLVNYPRGFLKTMAVVILLAILSAAIWGMLLLARNAPPPVGTGPVLAAYRAYAEAGVSPFALTQDKRYFWDQRGVAFLAYATRAGTAVVLGPGMGPADALPQLYREFRVEAHRRGWQVAFYQVSGQMADGLGWGKRSRIGDEAVVDLDRLTLEGPAMAKLRHEVSRARRQGVTVTVLPSDDLTVETRQAMDRLTRAWTGRRPLGPMAFSVGRHGDPSAAPMTIGLAHDAAGRLIGYTTWYQLPRCGGLVLDQCRRLPDAPGGAMQFLLYTVMDRARATSPWASLGLAPAGGPAAESLSAFKTKFRPRLEPRFMVVERLRDWPEAAAATLLLHYPELVSPPARLLRRLGGFNSWPSALGR